MDGKGDFMNERDLTYKNIEDIIPYKGNPRNNKEAIDKVAGAIKEFGFNVPITIDENDVVVTGHTRLLASKKLGLTKVPTITLTGLSDEQIQAFRVADNKVSEFSEWNEDLLIQELSEIESIDMSIFGFDDIESELEEELEDDETPKTMYLDDKDIIAIECDSEEELELTFMKLQEEGYNCRILTL